MNIKLILIALGAVIIIGLGAWGLNLNKNMNGGNAGCTEEAKLCPDGSSVGRAGPNCEFAPCPVSGGRIAAGYVAGHVTIGPNCPVEREGEPCETPPSAYTSREAVVFESNGITERERENLDVNGNYKIALGPGNYWIQIQPAGIGPGEKKPFSIVSFQTTTVNFDIDTGIR